MKTIITLLFALTVTLTASAQTLTSTNVLPFTYYTGTNNSYYWLETNVTIPKQRIQFYHAGITNFNALGTSNVVIRLQMQISNDWTTIETSYPSATNSITDVLSSNISKVAIPFRIQVVTTNLTGANAFRQQIIQ